MTSSTYCLIGVLLTTFFCDLSWSLRILRIPSLLSRPGRQLEYLNHASFELRFMSAVTDLPLQAINNLSVASKTELSFRIKEAKPLELASIVSLRVNVFFPEVCLIAVFGEELLLFLLCTTIHLNLLFIFGILLLSTTSLKLTRTFTLGF